MFYVLRTFHRPVHSNHMILQNVMCHSQSHFVYVPRKRIYVSPEKVSQRLQFNDKMRQTFELNTADARKMFVNVTRDSNAV